MKFEVEALRLQDSIRVLVEVLALSKGPYSNDSLLHSQLHIKAVKGDRDHLVVEVTAARGYGRCIIPAKVTAEGSLFTGTSRICGIKVYDAASALGGEEKNEDGDMSSVLNAFESSVDLIEPAPVLNSFPYTGEKKDEPVKSTHKTIFEFELNGTDMVIRTGKYKWELVVTREIDSFERLHLEGDCQSFNLSEENVKQLAPKIGKASLFAMDYNEGSVKSFFSGIFVILKDNEFIFTSTDDLDIYYNKVVLSNKIVDGEIDFLVPAKFFANAFKHFANFKSTMKFSFNDKRVGIEIDNFLVVHQNYDKSEYPPIRQVEKVWREAAPYNEVFVEIEEFNKTLQSLISAMSSNAIVIINNTTSGPKLIAETEAASGDVLVDDGCLKIQKMGKAIKFPEIALHRILAAFRDEGVKQIRIIQSTKKTRDGEETVINNGIVTSSESNLLVVTALSK